MITRCEIHGVENCPYCFKGQREQDSVEAELMSDRGAGTEPPPAPITEKELLEKLAECSYHIEYPDGYQGYRWDEIGKDLYPYLRDDYYRCAKRLLSLIKQAGYKSPEEIFNQTTQAKKSGWDDCLAWHKAKGYVQLDPNQSLPKPTNSVAPNYFEESLESKLCTTYGQYMINTGWRKIKK